MHSTFFRRQFVHEEAESMSSQRVFRARHKQQAPITLRLMERACPTDRLTGVFLTILAAVKSGEGNKCGLIRPIEENQS